MSAASDRIRRVLEDSGPVVRRASDLPPRTNGPGPDPARDRLRARLAALDAVAATPREGSALAPTPVLPVVPDDGLGLLERLGGEVRRGPHGSFLLVTRRRPLSERHGDVTLAEMASHPLPMRRRERAGGSQRDVDPRRAAYLDIETTGLAGGTGTVAFLVGIGRVEGEEFVVRQYFLRDFPDEPAMLDALAEDLGDAPLVTFNGRSFDWPLLSTRLAIHRTRVVERPHVDLLPASRRLWAQSLASHALADIERGVLGVRRDDDLPGALMPSAYFEWLRTGRSATIARAFLHNEVDIVSLAALSAVVGRILRDPAARRDAPAGDHRATALLLLDQDEPERARACLEAAVAAASSTDAARPLRRLLGVLHRRAGAFAAAERTWTGWIDDDPSFDAHPYESLAKLEEHRHRNPAQALAWTERALARCPRGDLRREALEARATRLRRKIGDAEGRGGRAAKR